jgi:signal transduction histidine kinase/ligand-binding sensor domain-containing protein/CheY-like chemotaxis protein
MGGRIAWTICAALACASANAQVEPIFRNLGVADGLPASSIADLMQDREGYLWLATRDGLARYDGVGFRVFRNDPADAESIACNDVQTVFEDSRERIWVGCADRGLGRLRDRNGGRFVRYDAVQQALGLDSVDVFSIAESPAGHLWLGTFRRGVLRLDAAGNMQRLEQWMPVPDALREADVIEILVDSVGDLWIGTGGGVWRVRHVDDPARASAEQVLRDGMTMTIMEADDVVWIGDNGALHRIGVGAEAGSIIAVSDVPPGAVAATARDRQGDIWVSTSSGLAHFSGGRLRQVSHARPAVPDSLPSNRLQDMLVDGEDGLWIATREKGLGYARPDWRNFELIRPDVLDETSPPTGRLLGPELCPDGRVYVASVQGVLSELHADGSLRRVAMRAPIFARHTTTHSLMCDPDGKLWMGWPGAVVRVDPTSGEARLWGAEQGVVPGYAELIMPGRNGDVWISSIGSGITRIDAGGGVSTWSDGEHGIAIADFEQLAVAADGRIWLAGVGGMRVMDVAGVGVFEPTEGGPDERVTSFALTPTGSVWTTSANRLDHWSMDGRRLQRLQSIGAAEGLPAVECYATLIDPAGKIWLTTARGLLRVDPERAKVELIDTKYGLPRLQYVSRPNVRLVGGKIVTAPAEGVLRFDPLNLRTIATPPPLRLAAASIQRGDIRVELDPRAERWDLRWDDRDLRVEARVLSFADPAANHYGFLLEGHDSGWVDAGARPEREFTRIQSGTYRLHIRASNVAGVAAANTMVRTVHVDPPPWLTWQAWLVYALSTLALSGIAISSWRNRIERRHRMAMAEERRVIAERANSAKSDFLADVGHEIRTPMAGVLGMADLLARSPLQSDQHRWVVSIKRSGEHMLRLINDLLDLSRIEAGKLELTRQPVDMLMLVDDIRALEAPLAEARGVAFDVEVAAGFPAWIHCDGRRLKQILLNLVNNALKFTERGRVAISVAESAPGMMRMQVSDTGPGMSADQLAQLFARFRQTESGKQKGGSGLGLAITAQLVRLFGGTIDVHSEPGVGTRIDVLLPIEPCAAPVREAEPAIPEDRPLAGIGVLLVEDDTAIREVNTRLLEALGADVEAAPHALEALSRFRPGQQRVAVLDIDLPGIDGMQLLALLRGKAEGARLIAVAVTARSGADTERRCAEAGFDHFMRKPVSAEQFVEAALRWRALSAAADR